MSDPSGAAPSLPVQLTRFIGREHELAEVRELLGSRRLVTLTGAGGSGKTRLALEAAARDGAATGWADLTAISDPSHVAEHVAAALGVRLDGTESAEAALLHAVRERDLLLVLDNCEHLLEGVSPLVAALLAGCPGLRVLATSREALGVHGEVAWLLPTLSLPPEAPEGSAALEGSEAAALFVARARDAVPAFGLDDDNAAAVAEICRRLDGLPLALELAAARVKVLAPEQIAARLHDRFRLLTSRSRTRPPRHRTLEEVVAWSYNLLDTSERRVLERLAVFVGDFSLEAAEEVGAGGEVAPEDVLDLVESLVSKSLVVVESGRAELRYRLLESVHQFARVRLEERGDGDHARRRHAAFFLRSAEAREEGVFNGGSDPAHLAWFESEMGELRAAAEWFRDDPEGADAGLRLATTPAWVWFVRGRFPEGRRWLETALHSGNGATPLARGRALASLALLAFSEGDVAGQRRAATDAVELLEGSDAPGPLALALAVLGQGHAMDGNHEGARPMLERAVALARDRCCRELVPALAFRGSGAAIEGALDVALACWMEACDLARDRGLAYSEPHLTDGLGRLAWTAGDEAGARSYFLRTLAIDVDDPWCRALAVQGGACTALMEGDAVRAAELLGAAAAARERIGAPPRPEEVAFLDSVEERCRAALGEPEHAAARARGGGLDLPAALALARGAARPGEAVSAAVPPERATPPGSRLAGPRDGLAVSALGPLEIRLHGRPLAEGAWSHAKPRELLLHLLAFPEGRTREQIGVDFWPDASGAQVKNSFHVLVHKLRRALGDRDAVVVQGERYRIAPELDVWFDAGIFEAEIGAAFRDGRGPDDRAGRLEGALALYRGHFMEGEPAGDWHLEVQDRLRRLYAEGLSALADARTERGDLEGAIEALERLVLAEELREDACRRLMVCLARVGRRDRALLHHGRLVALLERDLGAVPEEETAALAARLRASEPI